MKRRIVVAIGMLTVPMGVVCIFVSPCMLLVQALMLSRRPAIARRWRGSVRAGQDPDGAGQDV